MNRAIVPAVLKPGESAKYLGVSAVSLWRFKMDGKIPYVQLTDSMIGYRRKDLDQFIADRLVLSGADAARLNDRRRS